MKLTKQLSRNLEDCLQRKGLTFSEAALMCGINYNTISRIVNGTVESISARTERALCSLFGITPQELLQIADPSGSSRSAPPPDWAYETTSAGYTYLRSPSEAPSSKADAFTKGAGQEAQDAEEDLDENLAELDGRRKRDAEQGLPVDLDILKSTALWRWVSTDHTRSRVLRALGYKGDLPSEALVGEIRIPITRPPAIQSPSTPQPVPDSAVPLDRPPEAGSH